MPRRARPALPPPPAASTSREPTARIATARPAAERDVVLPAGYAELLQSIKADVGRTQVRAALAANRELIALYWRIGRAIVERQAGATWGTAVLERLAADLRTSFPGVAGFSRTNLFRIRAFYRAWVQGAVANSAAIVPQAVGQFQGDPWSPTVPQLADSPHGTAAARGDEAGVPPSVPIYRGDTR